MKFLTRDQCLSLINHSMEGSGWELPAIFHDEKAQTYGVERYYVRNRILSVYREIIGTLDKCQKCIALFDSMGVWPSANDEYLSLVLWRQNGCESYVEYPELAFSGEFFKEAPSFLSLSFHCGWDSFLFVDCKNWIFFSHDEFMKCQFEDKELLKFVTA